MNPRERVRTICPLGMVRGFGDSYTHHTTKRVCESNDLLCDLIARILGELAPGMPRVQTAVLGRKIGLQFQFGAFANLIGAKLVNLSPCNCFERAFKKQHLRPSPHDLSPPVISRSFGRYAF